MNGTTRTTRTRAIRGYRTEERADPWLDPGPGPGNMAWDNTPPGWWGSQGRGGGGGATDKHLSLQEWIASHRHGGSESANGSAVNIADKRKKHLEESVRILNSLTEKIAGGFKSKGDSKSEDEISGIHPSFITVNNVVVRVSSNNISAEFVLFNGYSQNGREDETRKENLAMDALGRMAYEMIVLEGGPSVSAFCSAKLGAATEESLSNAMSIHDGGVTETVEEDEIVDMLRKNPRMTTSEVKDGRGLISTMLNAGVPFPLCRFVSDLLDDEYESMFRSDHSFSSFEDVVSDLKQMMEIPDRFLHASSPDRWKLSFGEKLYGRDDDIRAFMAAAERVASISDDPIIDGCAKLKGKSRDVIMVTGLSGSGKSRLVRSAGVLLEKRGWLFLRCKFDRVAHPEPLSVLAHAFDEYFGSLVICPMLACQDNACSRLELQEIRERLKSIISPEGLEILAKHVPSLLLVLDEKMPPRTIEVNEVMMASLFGKLLQVVSSKRTSVLFFVDDLQWADPLSLALILALINGAGTDILSSQSNHVGLENNINTMFVGSYRDNEVDDDHPLARVLYRLESDKAVHVTNISLLRFTSETLNEMLSDSLCVPIRRVRLLSELVIQKTDGQPFHVIEFIHALTTDNLLTHSFARGWEWDADSIDIFPVSDSVAELLTYKLQRLPKEVLLGLQIMSCFGSQIEKHVLSFVADYGGESSVDMMAAVEVALSKGLVQQTAQLVSFSHDMVQKAAIDSISADDITPLLRKLAASLIKNASAAGELGSVLFVVVDLINRIGNDATSCLKQRMLFANLNLRAGLKAIAVPDFVAAAKYTECGIAFLGDDKWKTQYDLTLRLYEAAILSHFSSHQCNRDQLKKRIDAIFEHAKDFSDKFKTHCVWIKLLSMTDLAMAIEESLKALNQLGEPLDLTDIDYNAVCDELAKLKEQFSGEREKKLLSKNHLTDCNKERAMQVLASLGVYYHQRRSFLGAYVACQMMKITMTYGHCEYSVFGAVAFATSLVGTLDDIDEGSAWGRSTLSLMNLYDKAALVSSIYGALYGFVLVWKEPFQLQLEPLAQAIRASVAKGDVEFAFINITFYVSRSFFSGKNIRVLIGEVEALARQQGNHFGNATSSGKLVYSPLLQFYLTPAYNTLRDLQGTTDTPGKEVSFPVEKVMFSKNDDIIDAAILAKQHGPLHLVLAYQAAKSVMLRDMDNALKYTNLYMEHFETNVSNMKYGSIWSIFYEALITFHFMRQTGEEYYKVRGENALLRMKKWLRYSDWNFKNKLLLIEAECYNTRKEFDKAAKCYEASIKSAQEHKFNPEEAIANELAGIFFFERESYQKSRIFFLQSIQCYKKWGANVAATRVEQSMGYRFD